MNYDLPENISELIAGNGEPEEQANFDRGCEDFDNSKQDD